MRTLSLTLAAAFSLIACASSVSVNAQAGSETNARLVENGAYLAGSETARSMVENFLTNPELSDARADTGTENLVSDQIQLVMDESVCQ